MEASVGDVEYSGIVARFAAEGAELIRASAAVRYKGRVTAATRPLEPGFVPPFRQARVLIVSYYPNASDVDRPGTEEYERVRANFERWGNEGSVEAYQAAYADWLGLLDRIPFHRKRTKPILDDAGLANDEISWLPFVKVPLPAGSAPDDQILSCDIDATWAQLKLLRPQIVWIQGVAIAPRVEGLVRERITDRILPIQSVSQYMNAEKQADERRRIGTRLAAYLAQVGNSSHRQTLAT